MGTTTNLQIVLITQKDPYLSQATPKNTWQTFLPKKLSELKISNSKNPLIIPNTWNPEYPSPLGTYCHDDQRLLGNNSVTNLYNVHFQCHFFHQCTVASKTLIVWVCSWCSRSLPVCQVPTNSAHKWLSMWFCETFGVQRPWKGEHAVGRIFWLSSASRVCNDH